MFKSTSNQNIEQCRITSATTMNAHSSRSHAIFTVYLQVKIISHFCFHFLRIFTGYLNMKTIRGKPIQLILSDDSYRLPDCQMTLTIVRLSQVIYTDPLGKKHIRRAKLNLVDLAGRCHLTHHRHDDDYQ